MIHRDYVTKLTYLWYQIGESLFDQAGSEKVHELMEKAKKNNVKVVFPIDFITADRFDKDATVSKREDRMASLLLIQF
jgi:3-phosphoglycerate kinase